MEYNLIDIDNKEYIIYKEKNEYVLLINKDDPKDILINKIVYENDKKFYESLDSNEEFDKAVKILID